MRAYTADMIPGGASPVINVSQYDNDYAVTVTLIEGAEIYTPPSGATIRVEGTKPDGHGFEYPCTYQGNVVTMPIYTQMTVVSGRFPIELVVYQNGLRVGSCNIIFAVEKAPLGEDTDISETVIPDIIDAAQSSAEAAQEAAETAQEAAAEVLSSQIVTSASGDIAIITDGANGVAVKSLVAEITPVQSGSGDPSPTNISPISGRTGMTVTRAGKNLIDDNIKTVQSSATVVIGQTSTTSFDIFLPAGTYAVSFASEKSPSINYRLSTESSGAHSVISYGNRSGTFTLTESAYLRMWAYLSGGISPSDITWFQLEVGSTATPYTPYVAPTTYPITWESIAGTVYGGTLDVVSGVLTVDKGYINYDGSENWNWQDGGTYKRVAVPLTDVYNPGGRVSVQSNAGTFRASGNDVGTIFASGTTLFYYPDASITSLADYKTWLASNNLQIVYPLATPQTYQLTPTEVRTLLGGNTVYTDAGDVSVEYVADTKLYIDNKVAELQALILEN